MSDATAGGIIVRAAARIVVIDPADRVLLLAARDPADGRVIWFVPGGGVEPGETIAQAAARELAEEVPAAARTPLRGPVWTRHHEDFFWNGRQISQREWFFVARLDASFDAAEVGPAPGIEGDYFVGARWASVAELFDWPGLLTPRRMAELLPPILAGDYPNEPIDAGV